MLGGSQLAGPGDDLVGELLAGLLEDVVVGDVLTQGGGFISGNATGVIASVFPNLEFEVGTKCDGAMAVGRRSLQILFGKGTSLHVGDAAKLFNEGFTGWNDRWYFHRKQN